MIIIEPSFEILNPPQEDWPGLLLLIERAGRTCYKSEGQIGLDTAGKFVRMLIERGHESVIEHASATVKIICDRGVSHELVRHRLASYSQESTRYCRYKDDITVIKPCFWDESSPEYAIWRHACENAERRYLALLYAGAPPQAARSVLPNSLKTEIVMTANMREWRHFFSMRTVAAAHPEMRKIAVPMLKTFKTLLPDLFFDFKDSDNESI